MDGAFWDYEDELGVVSTGRSLDGLRLNDPGAVEHRGETDWDQARLEKDRHQVMLARELEAVRSAERKVLQELHELRKGITPEPRGQRWHAATDEVDGTRLKYGKPWLQAPPSYGLMEHSSPSSDASGVNSLLSIVDPDQTPLWKVYQPDDHEGGPPEVSAGEGCGQLVEGTSGAQGRLIELEDGGEEVPSSRGGYTEFRPSEVSLGTLWATGSQDDARSPSGVHRNVRFEEYGRPATSKQMPQTTAVGSERAASSSPWGRANGPLEVEHGTLAAVQASGELAESHLGLGSARARKWVPPPPGYGRLAGRWQRDEDVHLARAEIETRDAMEHLQWVLKGQDLEDRRRDSWVERTPAPAVDRREKTTGTIPWGINTPLTEQGLWGLNGSGN